MRLLTSDLELNYNVRDRKYFNLGESIFRKRSLEGLTSFMWGYLYPASSRVSKLKLQAQLRPNFALIKAKA